MYTSKKHGKVLFGERKMIVSKEKLKKLPIIGKVLHVAFLVSER